MPKFIVKPAINFLSTETDPDLIGSVSVIISTMAKHVEDYPNPSPPLDLVATALQDFSLARSMATGGSKRQTLQKNMRRADLVDLVQLLALYVASAANGDLIKLTKSGFPIHKPTRHRVGDLPAPPTPLLKQGYKTGILVAKTKRPYGTKSCTWAVTLESAPELVVQSVVTTGGQAEFRGLTPGQVYGVKVNAVGGAGPSGWSQLERLMVI